MTDNLYKKYGIHSVSYEASYINPETYSIKPWNSSQQIETTVSLRINQDALKTLLHRVDEWEDMSKKYYAEMYIREKNPTVQKAYEKYQMFLELARSEQHDRFN